MLPVHASTIRLFLFALTAASVAIISIFELFLMRAPFGIAIGS